MCMLYLYIQTQPLWNAYLRILYVGFLHKYTSFLYHLLPSYSPTYCGSNLYSQVPTSAHVCCVGLFLNSIVGKESPKVLGIRMCMMIVEWFFLDDQARQQMTCHLNCHSSSAWRSPWWAKHCIEVTIGSDKSFVGVLDCPKWIILLSTPTYLITFMTCVWWCKRNCEGEYMYEWAQPRQQWDVAVVFSSCPFSCLHSAVLLCWWRQHTSLLPFARPTCLGQAHVCPVQGHASSGHGEQGHSSGTFDHPLIRLPPQVCQPTLT